jgi:hypothetical protein
MVSNQALGGICIEVGLHEHLMFESSDLAERACVMLMSPCVRLQRFRRSLMVRYLLHCLSRGLPRQECHSRVCLEVVITRTGPDCTLTILPVMVTVVNWQTLGTPRPFYLQSKHLWRQRMVDVQSDYLPQQFVCDYFNSRGLYLARMHSRYSAKVVHQFQPPLPTRERAQTHAHTLRASPAPEQHLQPSSPTNQL